MSTSALIENKLSEDILQKVINFVKQSNYDAYLVGGYVRDIFLYRNSKDIDIVLAKDGLLFAQELAAYLKIKNIAIFKKYGTAQIKTSTHIIEIVNARKESYMPSSRNPLIAPGTLEDDQLRRDFTINALAISLKTPHALVDPFNGLDDLDNQLLKTPQDADITFNDDPLRILRGVRFASQLGFRIEPNTLSAMQRNASRLSIISQERITEELNKIILSPVPSIGFYLLDEIGVLKQILPEIDLLKGTETINGLSHKDNFIHTLEVLDNVALLSNSLWLRYAALLHDIAKPMTKRFEVGVGYTFHGHEFKGLKIVAEMFNRLKLPLNEKLRYVQQLVLLHLRPIALTKENITDSAIRRLIVDAGDSLEDLLLLCQSDITSKNEVKKEKYLKNLVKVKEKIGQVNANDELRNWQPCLSGSHILELVKIEKPQHIGVLKSKIREAILDGKIKDDLPEAINLLKQYALDLGLQLH